MSKSNKEKTFIDIHNEFIIFMDKLNKDEVAFEGSNTFQEAKDKIGITDEAVLNKLVEQANNVEKIQYIETYFRETYFKETKNDDYNNLVTDSVSKLTSAIESVISFLTLSKKDLENKFINDCKVNQDFDKSVLLPYMVDSFFEPCSLNTLKELKELHQKVSDIKIKMGRPSKFYQHGAAVIVKYIILNSQYKNDFSSSKDGLYADCLKYVFKIGGVQRIIDKVFNEN